MSRHLEVDALLGPVRRLAVFRALGLGDLLCATPALRALRRRFPDAHITLIGLPWAQTLAERLGSVDDFLAFPGHPQLPERVPDMQAWPVFIGEVRARAFDLLVQLHGSGRITNGMLMQWGARHLAAFHEPFLPAPEPDLAATWPTQGREAHRLMKLVDVLGQDEALAPDAVSRWQMDVPLTDADHDEARQLLRERGWQPGQGFVCVHPGSQWPSRRWPAQRFAEVASALAEQGHRLVLTGVTGERALGEALMQALPEPVRAACIDLVGRTSLWSLGALIDQAALLLCNDTGVSHVAAALGTPSVVVSCGSDVARWAPADGLRHAVLWADAPCRPCAQPQCPTAHECAWEISAASVLDAARTQLAGRA
ncbi:MAG: glycosyltransferase family 9 protein [Aquabacterium sp.]